MSKYADVKIIQIIPMNTPMYSKEVEGNDPNRFVFLPVVCLALVEDDLVDGQYVVPMVVTKDGMVEFCDDTDRFVGIVYQLPEGYVL